MSMGIFYKHAEKINNSQNQIVEDSSITPPPKKNVVFYNDDFTTMDFVVEVLVAIYNKSKEDAEKIMKTVHNEGLCVVGTYTYDIAVSRVEVTKSVAKQNGFPLRVEIE